MGRTYFRWTGEVIARVLRRRAAGDECAGIAADLGVNVDALWAELSRRRVTRPKRTYEWWATILCKPHTIGAAATVAGCGERTVNRAKCQMRRRGYLVVGASDPRTHAAAIDGETITVKRK